MSENKNFRMTRQRQIILSELKKAGAHLSADQVHQRVREKMPRISLATVYRNLEILSGNGLIRKQELAGAKKRFEARTAEHHHVVCGRCGRVDDLSYKPALELEVVSSKMSGYEITGYRIEFSGLCPQCRKNKQ